MSKGKDAPKAARDVMDKLPPRDLQKMIRTAIAARMDMGLYDEMLAEERRLETKLKAAIVGIA